MTGQNINVYPAELHWQYYTQWYGGIYRRYSTRICRKHATCECMKNLLWCWKIEVWERMLKTETSWNEQLGVMRLLGISGVEWNAGVCCLSFSDFCVKSLSVFPWSFLLFPVCCQMDAWIIYFYWRSRSNLWRSHSFHFQEGFQWEFDTFHTDGVDINTHPMFFFHLKVKLEHTITSIIAIGNFKTVLNFSLI
jgi:hypothetical protein